MNLIQTPRLNQSQIKNFFLQDYLIQLSGEFSGILHN